MSNIRYAHSTMGVFFFSLSVTAQYKEEKNFDYYYDTYNQVLITVHLDEGYSFDTYVLIKDFDIIYLNIEDIFNSLEVKILPELNNLVGFIEDEKNLYTVNFDKKQITKLKLKV